MKKMVIFIYSVLSPFFGAKGQENHVIFSEDFIYYGASVSLGGTSYHYFYFKDYEDTLISNKNFKKLNIVAINNLGDTIDYCCRFIREDINEKKVYFYDNIYNNQEILLYDFNMKILDTILVRNFYPSFDSMFFYVYKVDSISYNNQFFKEFWLKTYSTLSSTDTFYFQWVERIGNLNEGGIFHYYKDYSPAKELYSWMKGIYHYNRKIFCKSDSCAPPPDTVLNFISNHITGYIFDDNNKNCIKDSGEIGVPNKIVEIQPGDYFAKTDSNGFFRIGVGKDSFTVSLQDTNSLWMNRCHNDSLSYQVAFNSYRNNSGPFYFGMDSIFVNTKNQTFMDEKFIFYPNPSTGKINLVCKANYSQSLSVKIHNLIGISVHSFSTNSSPTTVTLDVSALSNGIYFAEVKTGNGNPLRYKFILSR